MLNNRSLYYYNYVIKRDLVLKFKSSNVHKLPSINKITCNLGFKSAVQNKHILGLGLIALELLCGQRGVITFSKKNIISLKIRKGLPIGCKVDLHRKNAYTFLDTLVTTVFSKIKYLKPLSYFDGCGNCTFYLRETVLFGSLEEEYAIFKELPGLSITINTSSYNDSQALVLFSGLQLPCLNECY
jgi:large subunit ribosomal protein L5